MAGPLLLIIRAAFLTTDATVYPTYVHVPQPNTRLSFILPITYRLATLGLGHGPESPDAAAGPHMARGSDYRGG